MAEHKKYFSRKDYSGPAITDLTEIIKLVKPTALLGLSTTKVRPPVLLPLIVVGCSRRDDRPLPLSFTPACADTHLRPHRARSTSP